MAKIIDSQVVIRKQNNFLITLESLASCEIKDQQGLKIILKFKGLRFKIILFTSKRSANHGIYLIHDLIILL